jgi:antitoxin component YwqK of YwqJK toxin-antitoxin module
MGCVAPVKDIDYRPSSCITIRDSLRIIRFTLYTGDKPVKPKNGNIYYWYGSNQIHISRSGYSGRLPDGVYTVYNEHGGLLEQGSFVKGLRTGKWLRWSADGEVELCIKYLNRSVIDTIYPGHQKQISKAKEDTCKINNRNEKTGRMLIEKKPKNDKAANDRY